MSGSIRRRGKASWEVKIELPAGADGKRQRRFYSVKGSRKDAEIKRTALLNAVNEGSFVDKNKATIGAFVAERIEVWRAANLITARTAERYTELLANQVAPHLGDIRLQKLRSIDVETWHAKLRTCGRKDGTGGISNQTIKHCHRLLSKAMKQAARHGLVAANVVALQEAPSVEDEEVVILTPEQVRALPAQLDGHRLRAVVLVALATGMRRAELCALRWCNVDLDGKWIKVEESLETTRQGLRVKAPKTKRGRRTISIPDITVELLKEHRRAQIEHRLRLGQGRMSPDAIVFPNLLGDYVDPRALSKAWRKFADANGMAEVPLHSLRHTCASALIDAGLDVVMIAKRLGHSPEVLLRVYAHRFRQTDERAAAAIGQAIGGL